MARLSHGSLCLLVLLCVSLGTLILSVEAPHLCAFWMIALGMGLLPAARAHYKGRNFFAWWLYGTLIWIVAMPHAILLSPRSPREGGT